MHTQVKKALAAAADPGKAAFFPRFFKAGKGEYAEGDKFMGVTVPQMRVVAKRFSDLPLSVIEKLLADPWHEMRMIGLFVLVSQFEKGDAKRRKRIVDFYLSHLKGVNNWDLVDLSAYKILGEWLADKDRKKLYGLAKSNVLWERRIAIVSTYAFIRKNDLKDTFALAEILLHDRHDLMHKAVGWMLREAGKRDADALRSFLAKHAATMPRTALRYAIEKFSETERRRWLSKKRRSSL